MGEAYCQTEFPERVGCSDHDLPPAGVHARAIWQMLMMHAASKNVLTNTIIMWNICTGKSQVNFFPSQISIPTCMCVRSLSVSQQNTYDNTNISLTEMFTLGNTPAQ
jgi:hypothetical protein